MDGISYRLKIRRDGIVKYYCEDGRFWNIKEIRTTRPKEFAQILEAQKTFYGWQRQNLSIANDWGMQIEAIVK